MSRAPVVAAFAAAVALCAAPAPSRAAEQSLAEKVDDAVRGLGELDANVRSRAAKAVRALGADAVPLLLERIPAEVGSKRWEGVLDALGALDAEAAIAEIQSTRSDWAARGWRRAANAPKPKEEKPPPGRGRGRRPKEPEEAPEGERVVDAILVRLRTHRADAVRRTVALEPGALWDGAAVPPWIAQPVGKKLPEDVAGSDVPVREDGNRLLLDVARDGKFATAVGADFARVIETGPKRAPRKVIVLRRLGRWYAAPAATLTGEVEGTPVEFLDADQDGAFDGDDDLVRWGGGAFAKIGADEQAGWTDAGIVVWRLAKPAAAGATGAAATLECEVEPEPAWRTPEQAAEMAALNVFRRSIGLAPQRIDRTRSESCRLHHLYWEANGFSGHDEYEGKPAYSKRSAEAGKRSSVGTSPDGARFARDISWTILHRNSCVGDAGDGVGAWAGPAGSLLWGPRIDAAPRAFPILVPGPGSTDAPPKCEPEIPVPDRDPRYYDETRGTPVCVTWSRLGGRFADLKDLRIQLVEEGSDTPRDGVLWCKEHRYKDEFASGFPEESAIFCADTPLAPGTLWTARFTATGKEGPVEVVWQFRTGDTGE